MMAATTTLLDLPEVDDDRPDDDCATCGTVHSADLHGAVLDLRSWLRHDLQRRLVALPVIKSRSRRTLTTPAMALRCSRLL